TTTLSVWGGLKDQRTLEWVSLLAGHHDRLRYQQHSGGVLRPGRTAVGTETVPTYRPGAIRTVQRGRVLVIHRTLPPILARTVDVAKRPDWSSIRTDIQTVRAGVATVSPTGYALAPPEQTVAAATPEAVTRW
ncbi:MAG: type IV secretory system conjugative DNA transfer family protein, partial [Pseudonocardiaceae bacterium]